jgi:hypothetical protein
MADPLYAQPDYTQSPLSLYINAFRSLATVDQNSRFKFPADPRLDDLATVLSLHQLLDDPLWDKELQSFLPIQRLERQPEFSSLGNATVELTLQV